MEQNEKDAQKQPQQAASDFVGANANKKEEASSSRPRNSNVAVAQIISTQQQREDIPVNKPLSSLPINSRVLLKNKDDDSSIERLCNGAELVLAALAVCDDDKLLLVAMPPVYNDDEILCWHSRLPGIHSSWMLLCIHFEH